MATERQCERHDAGSLKGRSIYAAKSVIELFPLKPGAAHSTRYARIESHRHRASQ
jgi:hypothetical protein